MCWDPIGKVDQLESARGKGTRRRSNYHSPIPTLSDINSLPQIPPQLIHAEPAISDRLKLQIHRPRYLNSHFHLVLF